LRAMKQEETAENLIFHPYIAIVRADEIHK
jgi:hypothetical protein